jgi:hypothetical protein
MFLRLIVMRGECLLQPFVGAHFCEVGQGLEKLLLGEIDIPGEGRERVRPLTS